jgi:predicted benzoate:H+ symporter BenE
VLGVIAYTRLAGIWFGTISGLSGELVLFAELPTQILTILPGLAVLLAFQRSMMVSAKQTRPVTYATMIEVTGVIIVLSVSIYYFKMIGATAAAIALLLGRLSANLYLYKPVTRGLDKIRYGSGKQIKPD